VVLTSPSTLLATLRTIEHSWRVERQTESARAIVEQAGKLYDKFCGFVEDMDKVGTRLRLAQESYDGARRKLVDGKGNLVRQADQLRSMGIKSRKALPKVVDDDVVEAAEGACGSDDEPCGTRRLECDGVNAA
jgi:DNA recombination protein RmuC